ncbi:hypothetical protein AAIR98_001467 [Elusimicrobium simillimum]|uniref:hypothetical protein n=1 Tax=Elusimicrobium simillimum TaxID=3143438 RepID=UPI003C6F27A5
MKKRIKEIILKIKKRFLEWQFARQYHDDFADVVLDGAGRVKTVTIFDKNYYSATRLQYKRGVLKVKSIYDNECCPTEQKAFFGKDGKVKYLLSDGGYDAGYEQVYMCPSGVIKKSRTPIYKGDYLIGYTEN